MNSLNKKKLVIIPVKVLIDSVNTYLDIFTETINNSIINDIFPEQLNLAEVRTLFKKADPFDKVVYRQISQNSLR